MTKEYAQRAFTIIISQQNPNAAADKLIADLNTAYKQHESRCADFMPIFDPAVERAKCIENQLENNYELALTRIRAQAKDVREQPLAQNEVHEGANNLEELEKFSEESNTKQIQDSYGRKADRNVNPPSYANCSSSFLAARAHKKMTTDSKDEKKEGIIPLTMH